MIENPIEIKKPDLLFISEANMRLEISDELKLIDGYKTTHPKTSPKYGYSRLVLLIREDIDFELLENLMLDQESSIWIKLVIGGRHSISIGGSYREHRLLLQQQPNVSGTPLLQQKRWEKTVNCWAAAAAQNKHCFLIGDLNLDFSKWQNPEAGQVRIVERVKTEIETQGYCQVIKGMTRFWPGVPDSQVNHCWTNPPGLILSHSNETWSSNHNLIGVMLRTKDRVETQQEFQGKDWKAMDLQRFRDSVKNIDWEKILQAEGH